MIGKFWKSITFPGFDRQIMPVNEARLRFLNGRIPTGSPSLFLSVFSHSRKNLYLHRKTFSAPSKISHRRTAAGLTIDLL